MPSPTQNICANPLSPDPRGTVEGGTNVKTVGRKAAPCCLLDMTWLLQSSTAGQDEASRDSSIDGASGLQGPALAAELLALASRVGRNPSFLRL